MRAAPLICAAALDSAQQYVGCCQHCSTCLVGNAQVSLKKTIRPDQYGTLCHGNEQARSTPTRLDKEAFGGLVAVMVACGSFHTMVETADGRLWTFGWRDNGQLGHGDTEHKLVPTLVLVLRVGRAKIVMVAAGPMLKPIPWQ